MLEKQVQLSLFSTEAEEINSCPVISEANEVLFDFVVGILQEFLDRNYKMNSILRDEEINRFLLERNERMKLKWQEDSVEEAIKVEATKSLTKNEEEK